MDDLWQQIGELAAMMHRDRVASVAEAIGALKGPSEFGRARYAFGNNISRDAVDLFKTTWETVPHVTSGEVAAGFRAAAELSAVFDKEGAVEVVWTGPKSGLIPTRHTEQVILEVIDSASDGIFLVSYVFYKASSIVTALNGAVGRNVDVSILLESSEDEGGTVKGDGLSAMRDAVPGAKLYVWSPDKKPEDEPYTASVHAKCAVADEKLAFVTSANLTGAAMERNMELGVLIRGGSVPARLRAHFEALMKTGVIVGWGN